MITLALPFDEKQQPPPLFSLSLSSIRSIDHRSRLSSGLIFHSRLWSNFWMPKKISGCIGKKTFKTGKKKLLKKDRYFCSRKLFFSSKGCHHHQEHQLFTLVKRISSPKPTHFKLDFGCLDTKYGGSSDESC